MPSKSVILGLSSGHGDSSAALIVDGCLVAAAEEERFTRVKHYALFPENAIRFCLSHAGLHPKDVTQIALARRPWIHTFKKLQVLWHSPFLISRKKKRKTHSSLESRLGEMGLGRARHVRVEHHLAHLMSARVLTPSFDIALLSFDGLGDFVSAAVGRPQGEGVEILERVFYPHSLGFFYSAMTQFLGFPHFGDEYKVMGLSSYGNPSYLEQLKNLVVENDSRFGFRINLEAFPTHLSSQAFSVENAQPVLKSLYNKNLLVQMLGLHPRKPHQPIERQHQDLAKSVQVRFEQVANHMLKQVHKLASYQTLGLAGGCAHNSVWVGKIPENTPFNKVLVAPASHDAGIAVGAAALLAQTRIVVEGGHWGLLGPRHDEIPSQAPQAALSGKPSWKEKKFNEDKDLISWMIEQLTKNKVLGLFRGRMEFGPRALGSRSILADPRLPEMKDILNARVKHREKFRPFAASVLWEHQQEWFEGTFFAPTMEAVFQVKKREPIEAVVHSDNSCRIQSVTRSEQPFYWDLIEAFRKKTGVPMLLNTSFNDCEPIVCTEEDAWHCFLNTQMDCLVIGSKGYEKI